MTEADYAPIIQSVTAGIALALTSVIGIFVPKAIAAFEARTGIELTAQQQATVMGAATTAAGIIQTKLDQGVLNLADVHAGNPTIITEALAAIARVPDAAAAMNKSAPSMAETIVGLVDTSPKPGVVSVVPTAVQQRP